jgi:hypothetical protein
MVSKGVKKMAFGKPFIDRIQQKTLQLGSKSPKKYFTCIVK